MDRQEILSLEKKYLKLEKQKEEIEGKIDEIKQKFEKAANEQPSEPKFIGESKVFYYIQPTTSKQFDSSKFKKDKPDLYKQYLKEVHRKGYIQIKDAKPSDLDPENIRTDKQYIFS